MMWDSYGDFVQIWAEELGGGSPATIESIATWHNQRGARGWITAGTALYHISGTPYFFYDGTNTHNPANPFDNWRTSELAYAPGANGDAYLSKTFQKAPYNHKTCGVLGMSNYRYRTGLGGATTDGTPLYPWHNDTLWGGSGAAAAVAAGEGTAAWTTALNSALTPAATYSSGGTFRTLLADFTMFCKTLAFYGNTGLAWDAEMYDYNNKDSTAWNVSYPTMPGGQSAATTRLYVKLRGQQLALIQATQMPNSSIYFYHQRVTGGWFELYRHALFGASATVFSNLVYDSFIAGLASVSGIDMVVLGESEFYKNPVMSSWDNAYLYDHNGILARMSQLFTDSERLAAMRRLGLAGMLWPTSGSSGSELGNAMSVVDFTASLRAAVKWGMFRQLIVWALTLSDAVQGGGNQTQDHGVYEPSFQAALVSANVDSTPPSLTVTQGSSSSGSAATFTLSGTVTDNLCVHTVEWGPNSLTGLSGAFQTTVTNLTSPWNPLSSSAAPQNGAIDIVLRRDFTGQVPAVVGTQTVPVTARDTHGNETVFIHTHTRS
jgi:hypothetical protein